MNNPEKAASNGRLVRARSISVRPASSANQTSPAGPNSFKELYSTTAHRTRDIPCEVLAALDTHAAPIGT